MKFASYDDAYVALGLPAGADFFEVKRAWRYLVKYHHPDIFEHARMRDEATERLKKYNAAFDVLRKYWEEHGSMPAAKKSRSEHSSDQHEPQPGAGDQFAQSRQSGQPFKQANAGARRSPKDEESFGAYKRSQAQGPFAEEAFWARLDRQHPSAKPFEKVTFGPPARRANMLQAIFDLLDQLESDAETVWISIFMRVATFPIIFVCAVYVAEFVFKLIGVERSVAFNTHLGVLLLMALTAAGYYLFYGAWHYQYRTYKILQHPFVEMSYRTTPDDVFRRLRAALRGYQWRGQCWHWSHMSLDSDGTWTIIGVMNAGVPQSPAQESFKITVKIWERASNVCAVVFWFEESGGWFKKSAARVLTETDERLREALGVPHPGYRKGHGAAREAARHRYY